MLTSINKRPSDLSRQSPVGSPQSAVGNRQSSVGSLQSAKGHN